VETTLRGIAPHIENNDIEKVVVRNRSLRWPIPTGLDSKLKHQLVQSVSRRGKYLLIKTEAGTLILHLGMSGSLRILKTGEAVEKHDHFEIQFQDGKCLRLRDPRRFGCVLFTKDNPLEHELLVKLGPEPFSDEFTAEMLYEKSRKKQLTIKQFIMDSKTVVGVGNIYASESLFLACIHPKKKAGKVSKQKFIELYEAIKQILADAIRQGGTTLKDFTASDGKPGYFKQELRVYDRAGEPCVKCGKAITQSVIGQRSTYYCTHCQK
ncbi:MAG: bifunctional DNA-formamidopyrimidine glycosylase/DNA-(apurinic or apyrimidinic site) lyase, partial [Gammaproteobacteria bacterium]|nr:bifunctional DNA-formamidopyrimidine glycosylase/DNA-(apurinic or apyrimidinic site) lyase [Gammaproteobacteria bacterium]